MFLFHRKHKPVAQPSGFHDEPLTPVESLETVVSGRHYRNDVPYLLPKDIQEINRLDFQHFLLRQVLKGNYVAPIDNPQRILDVGCGTGRWGFEVGQEFSQAQVTGADLEIPALADKLDTRYQFLRANILQGLPFPDQYFDFVHQRFLVTALPAPAWPKLINELIRMTAPGGWVELVDVTHLIAPYGPAGGQLKIWIEQMCSQRGIDPLLPQQFGALLKASPLLTDVHFAYLDLPVGDWGGRTGSLLAKDYFTVYESVKPLYQKHLQIDPSLFERMLGEMRQEWETFQSKGRVYVAYGRKKI